MEKRTPHYPLARVKALVAQGAYHVTASALRAAAQDFALIESRQVAGEIQRLDGKSFYKSMTTRHDSKLWQDVYRPTVSGVPAYVKVQIVDEATVVISFKASQEHRDA